MRSGNETRELYNDPGTMVLFADLVQLGDELPDVSVHPEGEEEDAGQLAEQKQQTQMMDMNLLHTLREDMCVRIGRKIIKHTNSNFSQM